jgi:hypothetical protein
MAMDSLYKSAGLLAQNYKVILMRAGLIGLMAMVTLLSLVFISSCVSAQDGIGANGTANISMLEESASAPQGPADIQGIWKLSLEGADIVMAVNQSGDSLFGQCKLEGDSPWNGVLSGEVSGRIVHIATAAMQGKVLACMALSGSVDGDRMIGSYVRYDSGGTAAKGELTGSRIGTDTADYTPAKIETTEVPAAQRSDNEQAQQGEQSQTARPAVTSGKVAYNDVTQLAKTIDPNIMPRFAPL